MYQAFYNVLKSKDSSIPLPVFYIENADVEAKSRQLASAGLLKPVKGNMQIHQVLSLSQNSLMVRDVSCVCRADENILDCPCFQLREVYVQSI